MIEKNIYLTADIALFKVINKKHYLLLIRRKDDPCKNMHALPGGIVDEGEKFIETAKRELLEETNIKDVELIEFKVYSDPKRDPRGRFVTTVFYGFVDEETKAVAGDDAKDVGWFPVDSLPELAFDHRDIITDLVNKIQAE